MVARAPQRPQASLLEYFYNTRALQKQYSYYNTTVRLLQKFVEYYGYYNYDYHYYHSAASSELKCDRTTTVLDYYMLVASNCAPRGSPVLGYDCCYSAV
eukprot:6875231-Pyramimonas_sp.AAC.1